MATEKQKVTFLMLIRKFPCQFELFPECLRGQNREKKQVNLLDNEKGERIEALMQNVVTARVRIASSDVWLVPLLKTNKQNV